MSASGAGPPGVRLVQYVVVRSDLTQKLSWPLGAVIAQACHAATAAIHVHYEDPDTRRYLADLDSMHKVVLAAPDEAALCGLADALTRAGVAHKLWVEQPEDIPTCLALKPYPKETAQPHMRKFKLFK
ncbi:putative peptidyl-tRNA hydrolase PTRHD1 isoform X1 [Oryzias latipes]|uniref:putative peptidyl-tRNA hydrolase PTRHD1 isoform X1 n=1 Tax=Oryzias latipes TaxID=8090 RepID=UPI0002A489F7|nr:putative peptidyl-tRNA hydrolase PTRHD1 isoform X1 [Oryzias latipes]